jgi:hypothetical protein
MKDVPAAVGTISVSLPPTWNWVAVLLTQAARAGEGKTNAAAASEHATTATRPSTPDDLITFLDLRCRVSRIAP